MPVSCSSHACVIFLARMFLDLGLYHGRIRRAGAITRRHYIDMPACGLVCVPIHGSMAYTVVVYILRVGIVVAYTRDCRHLMPRSMDGMVQLVYLGMH